jgi:hypothetical protein
MSGFTGDNYIYLEVRLFISWSNLDLNKLFVVDKVTSLPDTGNLRYLQDNRQQFGHQVEGVG